MPAAVSRAVISCMNALYPIEMVRYNLPTYAGILSYAFGELGKAICKTHLVLQRLCVQSTHPIVSFPG